MVSLTPDVMRVSILTPYLTESMEDMQGRGSQEDIAKQISRFSYDPNNLWGIRNIKAGNIDVVLETKDSHSILCPFSADLIIAGSTREAEASVRSSRKCKTIVARYSVFYGRASDYTKNLPEQSGYSFDIPKKVTAVRAMLSDEGLARAIMEREESSIREALKTLNEKLDAPILVTPYLTEALSGIKCNINNVCN
jgi:hypothetical protein